MTDYSQYDMNRLQARPLYFGLVVNVVAPVALLFGCYYASNNYFLENRLGEIANPAFYLILAIALGKTLLALWWRRKMLSTPMIRSGESFEQSLLDALMKSTRPVFLLIASISLWGHAYILLTGRFNEGAFVVLLSFLAFQLVRPRLGAVTKLIDQQRKLVAGGQYRA